MKNHKINFFESPNPRHINFHNFTQYDHYPSDDNQTPQNRLFSTPIKTHKSSNNGIVSPLGHFPTCPQIRYKRKTSEDLFGQVSNYQENIEQQPLSFQGIKERVSFSENQEEQDLLIPITPLKNQHKKQGKELEETLKKPINYYYTPATLLTPTSENRSAERGLKKLAAQAFRFVVIQKRTSYKQVAKKLIEQLGDESQLAVTRRGEMNIKRRVYDALNVLIALGLLRRNGNKIMSKRQQMQFVSQDLTYARERQRRRESFMQEQLAILREALQRKQELMNQKRKLQLEIKQKMQSLKEITDKNINGKEKSNSPDNKLQFPLMLVCYNKTSEQKITKRWQSHSKNSNQMRDQKEQQQLKIWQSTADNLLFSFNKHKDLQVLGQFDVLGLLRAEQKRQKALKIQKIKRRR